MKTTNRIKAAKLPKATRVAHLNGDAPKLIKLDLSYGELPPNHPYIRVAGLDPFSTKWPLKDNSVEEAYSAFLFQRIPGVQRGPWMDELYRVLAPEAKCTILVPYWTSDRAVQDPMSQWPPVCERSFSYFNRGFREINKEHLDWKSNFEWGYGYNMPADVQTKADEVRSHMIRHFNNAVNDLHVVLTKKA